MANSFTIDYSSFIEWKNKLDVGRNTWIDEMKAAADEVGDLVLQDLATYPAQSSDLHLHGNSPAPFYSDAQRRHFFWLLMTGAITVPYARTGDLGKSWDVKKDITSAWIILSFRSSMEYADYLLNPDKRSEMFDNSDWPVYQEIIDKRKSEIENIFWDHMNRALERCGIQVSGTP